MWSSPEVFYTLLFIVAFLYASVGHGGASGYLALMALFSVTPDVMKPTALLLNLFVASSSFIQFYRAKYFKWDIFWPLALASIPMAYLGGLITVDAYVYKRTLGILLLFPIARVLFFSNSEINEIQSPKKGISLLLGAIIGLFSGMIGIGGGIILSPVLLLLRWTDQKQTAAISALFILVNSASGLAGQVSKGIIWSNDMLLYVLIAFIGGIAGAYMGALKFPQTTLKSTLAVVLGLAAFKLLFTTA